MRRRLTKILIGISAALALAVVSERNLSAISCTVDCPCGSRSLTCGGDGFGTCDTWSSAWVTCGGFFASDSAGCSAQNNFDPPQLKCCSDICPPE